MIHSLSSGLFSKQWSMIIAGCFTTGSGNFNKCLDAASGHDDTACRQRRSCNLCTHTVRSTVVTNFRISPRLNTSMKQNFTRACFSIIVSLHHNIRGSSGNNVKLKTLQREKFHHRAWSEIIMFLTFEALNLVTRFRQGDCLQWSSTEPDRFITKSILEAEVGLSQLYQ